MMSDRIMDTLRLSAALLLLLSLFSCGRAIQFPDSQLTRKWAEQMQEELVQLIDAESGIHKLKEIFKDLHKHYTVKQNNAEQLVAKAASEIEKLLASRSKALEALATAAEKLQMEHQWKDDLDVNETIYYNAKDKFHINDTEMIQNRVRPEFKEDPAFKRLVSYNTTAVHIPTDIYEGSTIILNELNWTAALDEVFRKNKVDDPSLLWQVFGSATGLARYFPASPWVDTKNTPNKIDLYDVRRRPWYIQGAASPKDMLILVDASGSVSGLTLKLIRTSVSEMLETLSDDDYVNIVSFNNSAKSVACFENLVQANVRNKKILKEAVQKITANGTTDYKIGFKEAFDQLSSMNVSRANCNKIIMLFTDGGEDRASEIFDEYNPEQKVRIFTFSVGQHNYDKTPIQWMACHNKGFYYEIPSIGAIRINTQEYLDVLGRPMVKQDKKAKNVQWTNVYVDALELGLVITGTLPVFNKTKNSQGKAKGQSQLILGVMAIDVSLDDIKRLTPRFTLGPNGYYFAIDPNGYVLLHPNLQPKDLKSQEPVTLDFLDAELEDEMKVEIRRNMIDGLKNQKGFHTLVKSQDERYIDRATRTYTWAPVNKTDYSLALVLPDYSVSYIKATIGDTITQAKFSESLQVDKFEEYGYTLIAPRDYCTDLKAQSDNNTQFLIDFNQYIDTKTPNNPLCNMDLINRMLLDAGITAELAKYWGEQELNDRIKAKFVATDGGVTRVYPASAGPEWTEEAETYESSFYKRSLDNDAYIFTSYPTQNKTHDSILASRAMDLRIDEFMLKPAVVGVKLDIQTWMESFMNTTITPKCVGEICGCRRNDAHLDCVLLDDGGFLVMANQDERMSKIGTFFGMIDPSLMRNMMNVSLYSFNKTYDYQALCEPTRESKAAAGLRSVYVPTIADILNIGWWASAAAWSILQQLFVSITFPNFLEAVEQDDDLSEIPHKESCIKEQTQYFFENNETTFKGTVDCLNCSRQFIAEKLPKTNLVLIVADAQINCLICDENPFSQEEKPSAGPDPCMLAQNPRYRKGPKECFDDNSKEDGEECGGASGLTPSIVSMVLLQLLLLWLLIGRGHCLS
ncbi:voltage-dependent calcium channel subunit alpha-2/delta-1a isoform X2 [Pimephales promelas]|uniref:voltage-dependent calcium channel subunit alpha-2/delta-1a isoform X2 n=1 Tax=Pimephales promelas TaxID=90988 RepID=UPI00195577E9|nr:voltage-dependent calcium channel subunit alpha-2/delta-1a isoform X2 [Pimephales promelas]KAG1953280.1 voltage-dependent calcium channel subunit alpha-2/delta-1 [Pimephales promelas]KAG1953281.1 voltage-dependent calcium channel subunit alpha-2/delta-1 [Pimephales promelas]